MLITLLCGALLLYYMVLLASVVLSFALAFGWRPPPALLPVIGVIRTLTEPVLGLLRRYIPPIGGFDFSPLIVFILLGFARRYLGC